MQHKKFRDSTDEDDIKVLNSDYTRSLDEGMNRKDPEQQCHTQAEDSTEQNVEKEKQIWSLSKDLSNASKEMADSEKLLEIKNNQIKALEVRLESFEEEIEELHEKQEKILDCMYIEKQTIERRLMNANILIEEKKKGGGKKSYF